MDPMDHWVSPQNAALLTDEYELKMLQAYWSEGLTEEATFSLHSRRLPQGRNFMLACGIDEVLTFLETFRFSRDSLAFLSTLGAFRDEFLDWLGTLRFRGEVRAVEEGTPVFPEEPLVEVTASLPEAQVVETFLMNQIHLQTMAASKAARVVAAADGRPVVDFGLRRIHGTDAGLKAARAFYIAGLASTSNVLAGRIYGIPVSGTMAHSYVQAHDDELAAFREFAELYPDTVLLVDTYDTLEGVKKVVELASELGEDFKVRGIRLDSGDLADLSRQARQILDAAGLEQVGIFASGGLDEYKIADLLEAGACVTGFGVGTRMSVSSDAPYLDMAYKLTAYAGRGRLKLSTGKTVFPGRKQVFRIEEGEGIQRDVVALEEEEHPGSPLLATVMREGRRLPGTHPSLNEIRESSARKVAALPPSIRGMAPADPPFQVEVSPRLRNYQDTVARRLG